MAHERGDRVVEILATDGALGVVPDGLDPAGLARHRQAEHEHAAEVIGIDRIVRLGFTDSGMAGWDSNQNPRAFCNADLGLAAEQVARVLREEDADVFVHYDPRGNYGHPDHLMVHRVGAAAGALLGPQLRVLEGTVNQDAMVEQYEKARAMGLDTGFWGPEAVADDGELIGSPQSQIRWAVDLPEHIIATKYRALEAHASQVSDVGVMLSLSADVFALILGTEYYREPADPGPMRSAWPL
ncbi:1D-myo-inositol 2-acetamido-2-deoxy-alpha-D-glucopyranoside deacetylase [Propionibacterium australiense]|nr:Putative deacetylase LmbE-like domain [Propionibacterium australiense]VEH90790.1 1D-myo-inositol 2-acetamido-2-deoxy-alpha-D-glucopyranoside deacetylase [Propionibacterium australiense]